MSRSLPPGISRRYRVWTINASSLMKPSRTTWSSSNERRRTARRRALHGQAKSTGGWGRRRRRRSRHGAGMLYDDNTGIVSRSSKGLETMMTVIVFACSAFGFTVSEAKTYTIVIRIHITRVGGAKCHDCETCTTEPPVIYATSTRGVPTSLPARRLTRAALLALCRLTVDCSPSQETAHCRSWWSTPNPA